MKKIKILSLLALVIAFTSCLNRTDGEEDIDMTIEGSLTAKVDGIDFESEKDNVKGSITTDNLLLIEGTDADGSFIKISILNYSGVGTYKTGDDFSNSNSLTYSNFGSNGTWVSILNLGDGTIEITESNDDIIKGTFAFTGFNSSDNNSTRVITEGEFTAPNE